jgi:DNA topoisomerase I
MAALIGAALVLDDIEGGGRERRQSGQHDMRLIVTEKDNSAKKISQILSAGKAKESKAYTIPFYTWGEGEDSTCVIGLKGHLMNPAFPEGYSEWRKVEPRELIDAKLIKEPVQKNVHKAIRKQAKGADSVVIATDYDREGELIGLEALEEILDVNPGLAEDGRVTGAHISRARYSALTKEEIEEAFSSLVDLSEPLARAGEARQDIDLIWGATLTRFVSLATGRLGSQFLSVGRVQSPTLAIVVDRELERRAHVPKPYWEVFAEFEHPDGAFVAHHKEDRFWDEAQAKAALAGTSAPGVVKSVTARRTTRQPPSPFNTTAFTSAASSIGITPARAMRIAEDLYMDGFISYPRTDNTVYPKSLPVRELLRSIASVSAFKEAEPIANRDKLEPTRGKKETTDHPPIYPTQALDPSMLSDSQHAKIYELVARRFVATFADPSASESTRADIEAGSETYFVRGSVLVEPGFLAVYHYSRSKDEEIPKLEEGQQLGLAEARAAVDLPHGAEAESAEPRPNPWAEHKETQPPPRISQGKLIELMEEQGLGTKATRHDIIQKLYDRGYIQSNPIEPSETGIAMVKAFEKYAGPVATPGMTAELEQDMDRIANAEVSKDDVVKSSRSMLHTVYNAMDEHKEDLAKTIWAGMDQDRILGPCWKCKEEGRTKEDGSPNRLRIIRARKSGKRFVGCEGYPECDQTYGIPQRGDLIRLEEVCSICGKTPRVKVLSGRRPWNLCLNDDCPSMAEMRAARAEREAARAAKEAAEAIDGKEPAEEKEPAPAKSGANGAKTRKRKAPARS